MAPDQVEYMIEDLRDEIDALDNIIIETLKKRKRVVRHIQRLKEEQGADPRDGGREQEILDKIERRAHGDHAEQLQELYRSLFDSVGDEDVS